LIENYFKQTAVNSERFLPVNVSETNNSLQCFSKMTYSVTGISTFFSPDLLVIFTDKPPLTGSLMVESNPTA
jgi:hypothetical protein